MRGVGQSDAEGADFCSLYMHSRRPLYVLEYLESNRAHFFDSLPIHVLTIERFMLHPHSTIATHALLVPPSSVPRASTAAASFLLLLPLLRRRRRLLFFLVLFFLVQDERPGMNIVDTARYALQHGLCLVKVVVKVAWVRRCPLQRVGFATSATPAASRG